jgi:hypothetical protein
MVTAVLQATNLVTKADGIPAVFRVHGCGPASSTIFLTIVILCETFRTAGLQENVTVQNCEVEEMKEQFLHSFPRTVTDGVAVCHFLTSVTVTHMSILILHSGQLQDVSTVTTKVNLLLVDREYVSACACK